MFLKALFFAILMCHALTNDQLLKVLSGVHGLNKMSICMGAVNAEVAPLAACAGALWRHQWVATRASCVTARPVRSLTVLSDAYGLTCEDIRPAGKDSTYLTEVRALFLHPKYVGFVSPQYNLAVLVLEMPYETSDRIENATVVHELLAEYAPWMEDVYQKTQMDKTLWKSHVHQLKTFTSPMRMYITTVVLPSTCFIVLFLFLTSSPVPRTKQRIKTYNIRKT